MGRKARWLSPGALGRDSISIRPPTPPGAGVSGGSSGPAHPPYGQFCVASGHQLGFNDLKAIEVAGFLNTIAGKRPEPFNFRAGLRIQTLVETIQKSSQAERWLPSRGSKQPTAPTPARQARQWRTPKFPATTRS